MKVHAGKKFTTLIIKGLKKQIWIFERHTSYCSDQQGQINT